MKRKAPVTLASVVFSFCVGSMAQFKCPSSVMIAGPSQCGKTTFTKLLLQYADVLFERPIRKIVYCYRQWQECFQDMASQITFVEGIPEDIPLYFQWVVVLVYSCWMI